MATQTRLLDTEPQPQPAFHLDPRSRAAGRKGVAKARAALADSIARAQVARRADAGDHHAHAA